MARPINAQLPEPNEKPLSAHVTRKPKTLTADIMGSGVPSGGSVKVATTAEWNAQPQLIGVQGTVYVYSDHEHTPDGQPVPGFKVGDGTTYLIDAPFNDDLSMRHINDTDIHVTPEEKAFWNNKVTVYINAEDLENLVFSKE